MTLSVQDRTYDVDDISTGTELYVNAGDVEEGMRTFRDLYDLQSYTLNGSVYTGMVVSKISLVVLKGESVRIIVRMRLPTAAEQSAELIETRARLNDTEAQLKEIKSIVAPLVNENIKATASSVKAQIKERYPELMHGKGKEVL